MRGPSARPGIMTAGSKAAGSPPAAGLTAAASLAAGRNVRAPLLELLTNLTKEPQHEHVRGPRRHSDLLQGLGDRAAAGLQPRLAAISRCVRRPDVLPRLARLSLHRA